MIRDAEVFWQALTGSLFTWGMTALGAAGVFFVKPHNRKLLDGSLGFAAGVMSAASFWSLLEPALESAQEGWGQWRAIPVVFGGVIGAGFVYGADVLLPYLGVQHGHGQNSHPVRRPGLRVDGRAAMAVEADAVPSRRLYASAVLYPSDGNPLSPAGVSDRSPVAFSPRNGEMPAHNNNNNNSRLSSSNQQEYYRNPQRYYDEPADSFPNEIRVTAPYSSISEQRGGDDLRHRNIRANGGEADHGAFRVGSSYPGSAYALDSSSSAFVRAAEARADGPRRGAATRAETSWHRVVLLIIAIVVHNVPEGLVVGVGFGAVGRTGSATFESARNLALGIGIQNFPEGLAVSLPLAGAGKSKLRAFFWGQASGMVEPVAAIVGALLVSIAQPFLPYALSFAAGAMLFVVVDDIIPEALEGGNGKLSSWMFMVGFFVMMTLDVSLG